MTYMNEKAKKNKILKQEIKIIINKLKIFNP